MCKTSGVFVVASDLRAPPQSQRLNTSHGVIESTRPLSRAYNRRAPKIAPSVVHDTGSPVGSRFSTTTTTPASTISSVLAALSAATTTTASTPAILDAS